MKNSKLPIFEIMALIIGEIAVSLIICAVYLIIQKFSYKVITGAALGSLVTVFNFLFLSISASRAIDKVMAERGEGEMTEEEAAAFAAENRVRVQNAIKISYILRNVFMAVSVAVALLTPYFDAIATVIALVAFRPIIMLSGIIKQRGNKQ